MTLIRLRGVAVALALAISIGPAAYAAEVHAAVDQENTVVSELVVVAPALGPAWWRVSKGDSVVWIMALPPSHTPDRMRWDRRTLERRLKGARMMLAPSNGVSGFRRDEPGPILPRPLAQKVSAVIVRLGGRPKPIEEIGIISVFKLRNRYHARHDLTFDVHREVYRTARRARVAVVTPPDPKHFWDPAEVQPTDPEIAACLTAIISYTETPPERLRAAAAYWAAGEVQNMLAVAPKGWSFICRRFWPGHWERNIRFQTDAIASALQTPGKAIAVADPRHLVAEDGILQRLRAQGYAIADPAKPLSE